MDKMDNQGECEGVTDSYKSVPTGGLSAAKRKCISDYLHTEIYFSVLDKVVSEINRRFSSESQSVMKGICALAPDSPDFLNYDTIRNLAEQYNANMKDLQLELRQLKYMMDRN